VNKLKDKPFAMIGVNCLHDEHAKLKQVMARENITWRTFAAKGEIAEQWNTPGTPWLLRHRSQRRDPTQVGRSSRPQDNRRRSGEND